MDPKEIKTVRSAVESLEHRELEKSFWQEERPRIPWIVIGSVVFAVGRTVPTEDGEVGCFFEMIPKIV